MCVCVCVRESACACVFACVLLHVSVPIKSPSFASLPHCAPSNIRLVCVHVCVRESVFCDICDTLKQTNVSNSRTNHLRHLL